MATGTHQTPITCGMCETSADVDFFCLTCKGNLCIPCQNSHARAPMFKTHRVVPIREGLKHKATEEECCTHPSYICSMHCDDCNKLVCSKCISSGEHKGHEISESEDALKKVREEIKVYCKTLKNEYLPQCKNEEAKIKQNIAECKKVTVSLKSTINDKREEIITEVHRLCDEMITKAEDEEKRHTLDMGKASQKLQDKTKEIEQLMTKSKEALTKLTSEQIRFNKEKHNLQHVDVPKTPAVQLPTFKPGRLDKVQIRVQIGELLIPQSSQLFNLFDLSNKSLFQTEKIGQRSIGSLYSIVQNK